MASATAKYKKAPLKKAVRRGVIYSRVSSKEQEEGYSIDAQLKLLRDYCASEGIRIECEFVEAETAKASGRTRFGEMVQMVGSLELDAIVVEKTDRIYRNLKDRVVVDELGIELHLVKEGEVISNESRSHAKFVHDIKLVVSKNYIDNLAEETKKGLLEKARQGIYPTKAPLGYLNVGEGGKRIIIPDPERAQIIKRLFHVYAEGRVSLSQLTKQAEELGFRTKTGRKIAKSHLAYLLQNPVFIGLVAWHDETHLGNHEPLVSQAIFDRVQDLMHGRNRNNSGFGTKEFVYRGIFRCGYCGCGLTAELKKGKYIYYHCTGNRGECPKPFVREERLTEHLAGFLEKIQLTPDDLTWILEAIRKEDRSESEFKEAQIKKLRKDETRLKQRLESLYLDKLEGEISAEVYRSLKEKTESELARIRGTIASSGLESQNSEKPVLLLELASQVGSRFKSGSFETKREILKSVCSNCTYTEGSVQVSLHDPFDILLESCQKEGEIERNERWLPN